MSTTPTQRLSLRQRLSAFRPNPSVLLFIATIIAVTIANSSWNARYLDFLHYPVQVIIGGIELFRHMGHTMTISQVVNDALMAIFFFVVGLEIKQELLVGELSSPTSEGCSSPSSSSCSSRPITQRASGQPSRWLPTSRLP